MFTIPMTGRAPKLSPPLEHSFWLNQTTLGLFFEEIIKQERMNVEEKRTV